MSYRLTLSSLSKYFNNNWSIQEYQTLPVFTPLLQNDYGEDFDCTLTSITAIIYNQIKNKEPKEIYKEVELIAKNYFYNGKVFGTLPIFIKTIYDKALKKFNLYKNPTKAKYIKNISFNFNTIKENIKERKPMILSLTNDGRDYYKNHSVIIIGYAVINNKKMLVVYDNWYKDKAFIDYDKLCNVCCLNY